MKRPILNVLRFIVACAIVYAGYVIAADGADEPAPMTLPELIHKKGDPCVIVSGFEESDQGGGFVLLTLYGVAGDPARIARGEDGRLRDHYLVFSDDHYFQSSLRVHFENMKDPEKFIGSTMFASRNPSGTIFEIAHVSPDGQIARIAKSRANVVTLEAGEKGRLVRPKRP
jgi:hypothetical protein